MKIKIDIYNQDEYYYSQEKYIVLIMESTCEVNKVEDEDNRGIQRFEIDCSQVVDGKELQYSLFYLSLLYFIFSILLSLIYLI